MNHFVKIVSFCNIKQQSTLIQSKLNITMVRVCNIYMNLIHVVNMLNCMFLFFNKLTFFEFRTKKSYSHFSSFWNEILITEFVSVNHADHFLPIVHSLLYHVKVIWTHVDIMWIKIHIIIKITFTGLKFSKFTIFDIKKTMC